MNRLSTLSDSAGTTNRVRAFWHVLGTSSPAEPSRKPVMGVEGVGLILIGKAPDSHRTSVAFAGMQVVAEITRRVLGWMATWHARPDVLRLALL